MITLGSSLELEGYLDSPKNRSALAGLLNEMGTTASPHALYPPTYRWEPDGAVDPLGTTASPHALYPPTYRWEPGGAVDLF